MESTETRLSASFKVEVFIEGTTKRTISPDRWNNIPDTEEEMLNFIEQWRAESNYNWEPKVRISKETEGDQLFHPDVELSARAKRRLDYFLNHFEVAVRSLAFQLLDTEFEVTEAYREAADLGSVFRRASIESILEFNEKELKNRLPRNRGRPSHKENYNYIDDKYMFVKRCLEALNHLASIDKKLNKKNLAEAMFPRNGLPVKALTSALKKFELSMAALIEEHKGEGNILRTIFTKEIHRLHIPHYE